MEAPELIRNAMPLVAYRHQIDTYRLDPEAPCRCALGLFFGGIAVLVMLAFGTVKNIQP